VEQAQLLHQPPAGAEPQVLSLAFRLPEVGVVVLELQHPVFPEDPAAAAEPMVLIL
jgi:hypothetical protein